MAGFQQGFGRAIGPALRSSAALAEQSRQFDASQAQNQAQFDSTLAQRQEEELRERVQGLRTEAVDALKLIGGQLQSIFSNAPTPEQAEEAVQRNISLLDGTDPDRSRLEQMAQLLGTTRDDLRNRLLLAARSGTTGQQAGEKEAAAAAGFVGRELTERERLAKIDADIRPQSKLGQLVFDRDLAAKTFGEDSRQAKAFDDAINSGGEEASLSDIGGIRKEFTRLSGDFIATQDAFGRVNASPDTAGGDVALIFNFMKMLDPNSVVREGEFATAAAAAGLPERIVALAERVDTGKRLTAPQRQDFQNVARSLFNQQLDGQRLLERTFRTLSQRQGIDPQKVVVPFIRESFLDTAPGNTDATPQADTPTLDTEEDVEKLPSGSVFIWGPTGQKVRKD